MSSRRLGKVEAETLYKEWKDLSFENLPASLTKLENSFRNKLLDRVQIVKRKLGISEGNKGTSRYIYDVYLGISLYDYFQSQKWFSLSYASDPDFWRYVSIKIIPDIVYERWGDSPEHFYSMNVRIYPRVLWWFVYLSWQGSSEETLKVLSSENFTTDAILNLVERAGRKGVNPEVTSIIMKYYGCLSKNTVDSLQKGKLTLFRAVLKLNTVSSAVFEPSLCEGGPKAYVRELFSILGVKQGKYPEIFRD